MTQFTLENQAHLTACETAMGAIVRKQPPAGDAEWQRLRDLRAEARRLIDLQLEVLAESARM